jgi:hypothetical protein
MKGQTEKFLMPKDDIQRCSQYCLKQAASCVKMARLNTTPAHNQIFIRLADHWNQMAESCGGRLQQWATWCRKQDGEE